MARQGKTLPARRPRPGTDDALLIRSAESIGRMIGSLQRQLDGASKRLRTGNLPEVFRANGHDGRRSSQGSSKTARTTASGARAKAASSATSAAAKAQSSAVRKSKRAAKAAVASKSAGRARSGASRKSAKRQR